jgi:hypothetical protein
MTVDNDDPEEAIAFVRAELLSRLGNLGEGDPPWQTDQPHLLPRWQIASVRRVSRLNERGGLAE